MSSTDAILAAFPRPTIANKKYNFLILEKIRLTVANVNFTRIPNHFVTVLVPDAL